MWILIYYKFLCIINHQEHLVVQEKLCFIPASYSESSNHVTHYIYFSLFIFLLSYTIPQKKKPHTFPHQEVAVGEHSRGGRLLEEPKMMLFRGNTFSLQVSIQDIPQLLWSIKPFTTCQVGGF